MPSRAPGGGPWRTIRDEYLNVYCKGQSLARVFARPDGSVAAEVSLKYLIGAAVRCES